MQCPSSDILRVADSILDEGRLWLSESSTKDGFELDKERKQKAKAIKICGVA